MWVQFEPRLTEFKCVRKSSALASTTQFSLDAKVYAIRTSTYVATIAYQIVGELEEGSNVPMRLSTNE
jgi:hypothetical protein